MNGIFQAKTTLLLAISAAILLWLSQPPLEIWPLAFVAITPLLWLIDHWPDGRPANKPQSTDGTSRENNLGNPESSVQSTSRVAGRKYPRPYTAIWLAGCVFWLVSLQGLRHANPLLYGGWIALGAYLGIYLPLFVATTRQLRLLRFGETKLPLIVAASVCWVGLECVRNYLLTGISAAMLGHALADTPLMIQIADIFGTYGVSFVVVAGNVAIYQFVMWVHYRKDGTETVVSIVSAGCLLGITVWYGRECLNVPLSGTGIRVALIQCDEQTEYLQTEEREQEIFTAYVMQSLDTAVSSGVHLDAVVWPESMLTGSVPWMIMSPDAVIPPEAEATPEQVAAIVSDNRRYVVDRAIDVQQAIAIRTGQLDRPHLIGGSGVIHYGPETEVFSGLLDVSPGGEMADWYGKTHLVMLGEYIPLVSVIPFVKDLMPRGMGIEPGPGPKTWRVGDATLAPSICIETAVERVTIDQFRARLNGDATVNGNSAGLDDQPGLGAGTKDAAQPDGLPDVVVTVTNDAWFDGTSVVSHHLRCAQLVAVGCRRPVLSAANGGPTAWIDSSGRIVERLDFRSNGAIIATPKRDTRTSLYVRIGDWPARSCGLVALIAFLQSVRGARRKRRA